MGTTFVSVTSGSDAPGFWMRDAVLELWLRFLALHVEDSTASGSLEATIRDQWLLASRGYFNGCVPHNMQQAVSTEAGTQIVRKAVASLLEHLSKGPTHIAAETLNLMGFSGSPFQHDVEAWRLTEVGHAFLDLLDGKITVGARSKEFMPGCREQPTPNRRSLPGSEC
jgi:hypothetical protein